MERTKSAVKVSFIRIVLYFPLYKVPKYFIFLIDNAPCNFKALSTWINSVCF